MLIQFIYAIMTMTESMTIREKQKYHRVETGKVESKHLSWKQLVRELLLGHIQKNKIHVKGLYTSMHRLNTMVKPNSV